LKKLLRHGIPRKFYSKYGEVEEEVNEKLHNPNVILLKINVLLSLLRFILLGLPAKKFHPGHRTELMRRF